MDDLIAEFITETNESLEELDNDLVNLEQNPNDKDLLSKIFRLMHTIKGTCGFLNLPRLEKVAHHAENVLGRFRDGDLDVTPDCVSLIFESIDTIKFIVGEIAMNGSEPETDSSSLIRRLDEVYEGKSSAATTASTPDIQSAEAAQPADMPEEEFEAVMATGSGDDSFTAPDTAMNAERVDIAVPALPPETAPALLHETRDSAPDTTAQQHHGQSQNAQSTQSLRVNVEVLEDLMTMVSELVLTRNQLMQILRSHTDSDFTAPLQRLNMVVSDLQEGVMKTRMQPIGNAWSKLPRIIRDLSIELNKKVDLVMIGQDTELDRQVLEFIKDPLTHMVRNSADHGIESPAARLAAGKPEMGTVTLNAYHEGGHIIISIADDGKGLSTERIKEKIIANGLASAEEVAAMSPQQLHQYIFRAGFSTAEKVTSVSGRGVGMDVVRTNIERIGGSIELHSVEGKGSTFTIKIPLTLAIVSALIVESAGERFAIPQLAVRELVMAGTQGDNRIETINDVPVFRLRDHLLPLITLSDVLKIKTPQQGREPASQNRYIIVTQVGNYSFGIIVDRVFDTEEIVVKPVASILRNIDIFSGNTILGDGSVIMILDPNGLARASGEIDLNKSNAATSAADALFKDQSQDKVSLLLFMAGDETPKAVPLSLVSRIENVDLNKIEHSGNTMVVQYRGALMPLLKLNDAVTLEGHQEKPVLVFNDKDSSVGLIADKIIDIAEDHIKMQQTATTEAQSGILGSAIICDRATDIVDVAHYLASLNKNWYKDHGDEPFQSGSGARHGAHGVGNSYGHDQPRKRHILLVDDSPFFRNMLTPMLSMAGYAVTSLESPLDALKLCEKGVHFDLIVSDIEMPDMDGFEFAEKVRISHQWRETPMIALTSHTAPQDLDRGHTVGFDDYIPKFDREILLGALSRNLAKHIHGNGTE